MTLPHYRWDRLIMKRRDSHWAIFSCCIVWDWHKTKGSQNQRWVSIFTSAEPASACVCVGWEQEYRFSRKILSRLFIAGWRIRKDSVWGVVGTFGQKLPRYRTCRYFRHWSVKTSKKRTIGAKQRPWTLWKGCCLILLFLKLFITNARTQECIFLVLEVLVDVFMVKNLEKLQIDCCC